MLENQYLVGTSGYSTIDTILVFALVGMAEITLALADVSRK